MNVEKVVSELKNKYPGKTIVFNPPENPTEIVCETGPAKNGENPGFAIAIVDESKPHYHNETTEYYEVLRGDLTIMIDGKKHELKRGNRITIKPGQIHFAKGNETWVLCISNPSWRPEDHILVK